ncbi:Holliday junction endonuclease RuvC [Verrucomicrobium sp. GAS474]|uniref:crossover junction endodeoxyribonuclease RuvC n=1 Tax=Verrucomicrobium sp. GAS474 TaxID=1882831 RepID=UPI00087D64D9|nr:crossover junction endodeoxyribonuclease RuvC [Verrucomicrobium sp. GAS474]SDT93932.1 Holliday junction endonuclease RuvC [Verrucomicrobium sp. GAS474]
MRVLGIDPALRNTGYGLIDTRAAAPGSGRAGGMVAFGVIRTGKEALPSECLRLIAAGLREVIALHKPDVAAVEGIIFVQSHRTAITMGAARGAALVALAEAGVPVYEYAPTRVKAAATGGGGAKKAQVGFMMRALLGLSENPPADAADALAIALTHAQTKPGLTTGTRL